MSGQESSNLIDSFETILGRISNGDATAENILLNIGHSSPVDFLHDFSAFLIRDVRNTRMLINGCSIAKRVYETYINALKRSDFSIVNDVKSAYYGLLENPDSAVKAAASHVLCFFFAENNIEKRASIFNEIFTKMELNPYNQELVCGHLMFLSEIIETDLIDLNQPSNLFLLSKLLDVLTNFCQISEIFIQIIISSLNLIKVIFKYLPSILVDKKHCEKLFESLVVASRVAEVRYRAVNLITKFFKSNYQKSNCDSMYGVFQLTIDVLNGDVEQDIEAICLLWEKIAEYEQKHQSFNYIRGAAQDLIPLLVDKLAAFFPKSLNESRSDVYESLGRCIVSFGSVEPDVVFPELRDAVRYMLSSKNTQSMAASFFLASYMMENIHPIILGDYPSVVFSTALKELENDSDLIKTLAFMAISRAIKVQPMVATGLPDVISLNRLIEHNSKTESAGAAFVALSSFIENVDPKYWTTSDENPIGVYLGLCFGSLGKDAETDKFICNTISIILKTPLTAEYAPDVLRRAIADVDKNSAWCFIIGECFALHHDKLIRYIKNAITAILNIERDEDVLLTLIKIMKVADVPTEFLRAFRTLIEESFGEKNPVNCRLAATLMVLIASHTSFQFDWELISLALDTIDDFTQRPEVVSSILVAIVTIIKRDSCKQFEVRRVLSMLESLKEFCMNDDDSYLEYCEALLTLIQTLISKYEGDTTVSSLVLPIFLALTNEMQAKNIINVIILHFYVSILDVYASKQSLIKAANFDMKTVLFFLRIAETKTDFQLSDRSKTLRVHLGRFVN